MESFDCLKNINIAVITIFGTGKKIINIVAEVKAFNFKYFFSWYQISQVFYSINLKFFETIFCSNYFVFSSFNRPWSSLGWPDKFIILGIEGPNTSTSKIPTDFPWNQNKNKNMFKIIRIQNKKKSIKKKTGYLLNGWHCHCKINWN